MNKIIKEVEELREKIQEYYKEVEGLDVTHIEILDDKGNIAIDYVESLGGGISSIGTIDIHLYKLKEYISIAFNKEKVYKIPVEYKVWGLIDVHANSLEEALEYAENNVKELELPDNPEYIEDSYIIAVETIEEARIHNK